MDACYHLGAIPPSCVGLGSSPCADPECFYTARSPAPECTGAGTHLLCQAVYSVLRTPAHLLLFPSGKGIHPCGTGTLHVTCAYSLLFMGIQLANATIPVNSNWHVQPVPIHMRHSAGDTVTFCKGTLDSSASTPIVRSPESLRASTVQPAVPIPPSQQGTVW